MNERFAATQKRMTKRHELESEPSHQARRKRLIFSRDSKIRTHNFRFVA